jgi:transposase
MKQITLSPEQKVALETRHKSSSDRRECDRIKAILLRDENWPTPMIAQALRIHETTVVRYIDAYAHDQKLTCNSGGSLSYLSQEQTELLIAHLCEVTYLHSHQIVAYISEQFQIKYTVSGLNKWLHKHQFSYKNPKGVPHKFDEDKQTAFIEYYEQLKSSITPDEPLLFMDAVHPTQATKITAGWIRKGVDKPIETTGSRTRINVVGAIRLGHLKEAVIEQYSKTVNGVAIIDFFNQIRARYSTSGVIHLVLDGAGYHRNALVVKEAENLNITLHYLPPYSPNLNPIERLWKVMNKHARNGQYFATTKEFRRKITDFFSITLPEIADTLGDTINDNFQKLKPAV